MLLVLLWPIRLSLLFFFSMLMPGFSLTPSNIRWDPKPRPLICDSFTLSTKPLLSVISNLHFRITWVVKQRPEELWHWDVKLPRELHQVDGGQHVVWVGISQNTQSTRDHIYVFLMAEKFSKDSILIFWSISSLPVKIEIIFLSIISNLS